MSDRPSRALIIGIDGATFDVARVLLARGALENLARLIETGASGPLLSPLPITPAAWTSIATGLNPGNHGCFDFITRESGSYRPVPINHTHRRAPALWNHFNTAGKRAVVLNYPVTYPPEPIDGVMVSGMLTPSLAAEFTHPTSLKQELETATGGYRVGLREPFAGNEAAFVADCDTVTEAHRRAALHLITDQPWDLFICVFMAVDTVSHMFWRDHDPTHPRHDPDHAAQYGDTIAAFYRKLDRIVGQLVAAAGTGTLTLVVSDHGFGPLEKYVDLNRWLAERGLLVPHRRSAPSLGSTQRRRRVRSRRKRLFFGRGRLDLGTTGGMAEMGETGAAEEPAVDWSRTRAYSLGILSPINANRTGREPDGIVTDAEAEVLLARIDTDLRALKDPGAGKPLYDFTLRRDEVCTGPYSAAVPDLFVILDGMRYIGRGFSGETAAIGPLFSTPPESGTHRVNGIAIINGPGIEAGATLKDAEVIDIAPTILAALGIAHPPLDGRVLIEGFTPDLAAQLEPSGTAGADTADTTTDAGRSAPTQRLPDEDELAIKQRLRVLGYIGNDHAPREE